MLRFFLQATLLLFAAGDKLDDAIANDLLMDSSPLCEGPPPESAQTAFISNFFKSATSDPSLNIEDWRLPNRDFEEDAFMVEMQHTDSDPDKSWQLRIGKGGQVVSQRGPFGEAVSNQGSATATWNDLVQQLVAVSSNNVNSVGHQRMFIHGSGPYRRDTEIDADQADPPFYNPTVALSCGGNKCTSVNWGQQAHVPTLWGSNMLYYQRYRNCGNGVIEYDQVIHYFGEGTEAYTYFNTPWAGVRSSTFRDVLIAKNGALEHVFPLLGWGNNPNNTHIVSLPDTDGYTVFSEYISVEGGLWDPGFCVVPEGAYVLSATGEPVDESRQGEAGVVQTSTLDWTYCNSYPTAAPFALTAATAGRSTGHETNHDLDMVLYANMCDLAVPIRTGYSAGYPRENDFLLFVNKHPDRLGNSVKVGKVIHWCWNGKTTYFGTKFVDGVTTYYDQVIFNELFQPGDPIELQYEGYSKPESEQYALSWVHGTNPERDPTAGNSWYRADSRVRWGTTNSVRDGTVFTTNFIGNLNPGQTYFNRKYQITGKYENIAAASEPWVDETDEDLMTMGQINPGQSIGLYYEEIGSTFWASIGSEIVSGSLACSGSTTPKDGSRPLFYITCDTTVYIGSDPYGLSITDDPNERVFDAESGVDVGPALQSWRCNGIPGTRPSWKLLGYFVEGSCDVLAGRTYDPVAPTCADSVDFLYRNRDGRDCAWVGGRPENRCGGYNQDGFYAWQYCPVTCAGCDDLWCADEEGYNFRGNPSRTCRWASRNIASRCGRVETDGSTVADHCPLSCEVCSWDYDP